MEPGNGETDERIIVHLAPDMMEIAPEFLDNARGDIQTLLHAIRLDDYETIRILGHGMKGVGDFGFEYLSGVGLSLELAAAARNLADIEKLTEQMATYLERVEVVFQQSP